MKKFLSIVMAVALLALSGTSSYAMSERDQVVEELRQQAQDLQETRTAHAEELAELVRQGTPAGVQNSAIVEIKAQFNEIKRKLQVEQIQIQARIKQATTKGQEAVQLNCSRCGGDLRLDETRETGLFACQKYPLDMGIMDEGKAYCYVCVLCGNEDIYSKAVCFH